MIKGRSGRNIFGSLTIGSGTFNFSARTPTVSLGKHRNVPDSHFDPRELAMGIKEEMEHTNDWHVSKEVAKDHLMEDPHYYTKLKKAGL